MSLRTCRPTFFHDPDGETGLHASTSAGRSRRLLTLGLALGAGLGLASCSALPQKPPPATLYDFGPPAANPPAAPAAALGPIALAEVEANARLDGTQVLYRLGYADPNELRPYTRARWSVAPAVLLRQRLRDALGQTRPVLDSQEAATLARERDRPMPTLRLALDEFSQWFDSSSTSRADLRLRATLVRRQAGGEQLLGQQTFASRMPAPSADAAGGVRALIAASDAVIAEVVAWANQPR